MLAYTVLLYASIWLGALARYQWPYTSGLYALTNLLAITWRMPYWLPFIGLVVIMLVILGVLISTEKDTHTVAKVAGGIALGISTLIAFSFFSSGGIIIF